MKQLKEQTTNTIIDLLNREIEEELNFTANGQNLEQLDYLQDLIEAKADLLRATAKTTIDLIIAKSLIENDLLLLKERKK